MKPTTLFQNHSENLIERYIPGRSDYHEPQNNFEGSFAQPIEDEDIFNVEPQESSGSKSPKLDDLIEMPSIENHCSDTFEHDIRSDKRHEIGYSFMQLEEEDEEDIVGLSKLNSVHGYEKVDIDKLFVDDYSQSNDSQKLAAKQTSQKSDENKEPALTRPPQPTPSQTRRMQLLEKIRQQAQSMSLVPKKIGSDLNKDGMIDICIDDGQLISDSNSKFIFNSLFNKSKKANESYESGKLCWNQYKQALQKSICAKKRKIWDSFQKPTDNYDEEEELIEEVQSPKSSSHRVSEADVEIEEDDEIEQVTLDEDDDEPLKRFRRISDDDENDDDDDDNDDDVEASNGNLEDLEREDALILDEANHSWSDQEDQDKNRADDKKDSDDDSDKLSILDDSSDDSD